MESRLIGTDEAGYGPNLGPLVISATQWETPEGLCDGLLWDALEPAVSQTGPHEGRLHIADSKQVYSPGRGLAELERSVLSLLALLGEQPPTLSELRRCVTLWRQPEADEFAAAWYTDEDVSLPVVVACDAVAIGADRLAATLSSAGVRLIAIRSDVMSESRFNRWTNAAGSKGAVLTEATLALAGSLVPWGSTEAALVLCDKHGGRNRYAGVLSQLANDGFVATQEESRDRSAYRVGKAEFRFETRAERHLPVAAASMVSKYLRELSMLAFNQFWQRHQPDLKPTKGYPQDAVRYRAAIAETQARLGIVDDTLWRNR
jgi:hypothetical protein